MTNVDEHGGVPGIGRVAKQRRDDVECARVMRGLRGAFGHLIGPVEASARSDKRPLGHFEPSILVEQRDPCILTEARVCRGWEGGGERDLPVPPGVDRDVLWVMLGL